MKTSAMFMQFFIFGFQWIIFHDLYTLKTFTSSLTRTLTHLDDYPKKLILSSPIKSDSKQFFFFTTSTQLWTDYLTYLIEICAHKRVIETLHLRNHIQLTGDQVRQHEFRETTCWRPKPKYDQSYWERPFEEDEYL